MLNMTTTRNTQAIMDREYLYKGLSMMNGKGYNCRV